MMRKTILSVVDNGVDSIIVTHNCGIDTLDVLRVIDIAIESIPFNRGYHLTLSVAMANKIRHYAFEKTVPREMVKSFKVGDEFIWKGVSAKVV